jgi:hypothetical protein
MTQVYCRGLGVGVCARSAELIVVVKIIMKLFLSIEGVECLRRFSTGGGFRLISPELI